MTCISVNDMLIKLLSGDYPLHQMVFVRSAIGISFNLVVLQFEGGFAALRTDKPFAHLMRGLLIVVSNMAFFAALAVIPLASATALFFIAPLFITLMSIPLLGETVGPRRIAAVVGGFVGVLIMLGPWNAGEGAAGTVWVLLLPLLSAFTYASMQILTRRLGVASTASAMRSTSRERFWSSARCSGPLPAMANMPAPWNTPACNSCSERGAGRTTGTSCCSWPWAEFRRSSAIRFPRPTGQPLRPPSPRLSMSPCRWRFFLGWMFWGELPDAQAMAGIALIVGAGLYIFLREGIRRQEVATRRPIRRW